MPAKITDWILVATKANTIQQVHPVSNFQPCPPSDGSKTIKFIYTSQDPPTFTNAIKNGQSQKHIDKTYCTQILVSRKIELQQYKRDTSFAQWLRKKS
jgi:hypothetical protein